MEALHRLFCSDNCIRNAGACALAEALKDNFTLREIRMPRTSANFFIRFSDRVTAGWHVLCFSLSLVCQTGFVAVPNLFAMELACSLGCMSCAVSRHHKHHICSFYLSSVLLFISSRFSSSEQIPQRRFLSPLALRFLRPQTCSAVRANFTLFLPGNFQPCRWCHSIDH